MWLNQKCREREGEREREGKYETIQIEFLKFGRHKSFLLMGIFQYCFTVLIMFHVMLFVGYDTPFMIPFENVQLCPNFIISFQMQHSFSTFSSFENAVFPNDK